MRHVVVLLVCATLAVGCASRRVILDVQGTILYEKPAVERIAYETQDDRRDGGRLVVTVTLEGDPGLSASFDITPGIVDDEPMAEGAPGVYSGRFAFPADVVGGPFTIIGSLSHPRAGEVVVRDPRPLTIPLVR